MRETKEIKYLSGRVGQFGYHVEYKKKVRFSQLLIAKAILFKEFPPIYDVRKWDFDDETGNIIVDYADGCLREANVSTSENLRIAVRFFNKGLSEVRR